MIDVAKDPLQSSKEPTRGTVVRRRIWTSVAAVLVLLAGGLSVPPAYAVTASAAFTGGAGTTSVGGTLYAKSGGALTLTVSTSSDTKCISGVPAAYTGARTSSTARTSWTFTGAADSGDGIRAYTIGASSNFNANNCNGQSTTTQASYVADNTGPVVTGVLSPAPSAAGWNKSDVTLSWIATDAGSGVPAAQPFSVVSISANGIATRTAAAQTDRLGNVGTPGSTTVRIDKVSPVISAGEVTNPNGTTTVTFTCTDPGSGGNEASGIASCLADGTSTNAKTVQPGTTVGGTATDNAGNVTKTSVTVAAGDTTAPVLNGTPTTAPNGAGWYDDD
ncbi:MAG: hypothetical protein ABWY23_11770, partial [Mycetocola sp.]